MRRDGHHGDVGSCRCYVVPNSENATISHVDLPLVTCIVTLVCEQVEDSSLTLATLDGERINLIADLCCSTSGGVNREDIG